MTILFILQCPWITAKLYNLFANLHNSDEKLPWYVYILGSIGSVLGLCQMLFYICLKCPMKNISELPSQVSPNQDMGIHTSIQVQSTENNVATDLLHRHHIYNQKIDKKKNKLSDQAVWDS